MGDPRKLRKKYQKPSHPWQKARIEEEAILVREYGFKNKLELWKLNSKLSRFKSQVKNLIPKRDELAEQQKKNLIKKIQKYNLIKDNAILEDILAIKLKDLCERRLQTLAFKKGLARSISQARQLIVHEHIKIGDKKLTSPSYIVSVQEEAVLKFAENSKLADESHPERIAPAMEVKKEILKAAGSDIKKDEKQVEEVLDVIEINDEEEINE